MKEEVKLTNVVDQDTSFKERRKSVRKVHSENSKNNSLQDELESYNGFEFRGRCDCLIEECLGCHFPCTKCGSCKCGNDCRVNRKWLYETVKSEAEM